MTWTLPAILANGNSVVNQIDIAQGAITDVSGVEIETFTEQYTTDNLAPRMIDESIQEGAILLLGSLAYSVTFSEPMNTAVRHFGV